MPAGGASSGILAISQCRQRVANSDSPWWELGAPNDR